MLHDLLAEQADVAVVDMEAGLEHLSRSGGTLAYADVLLVVMEPTRKSVVTAARTAALAADLGIPRTYGIGNKAAPGDAEFFSEAAAQHGLVLAGVVPADDDVVRADRAGEPVTASPTPAVRDAVAAIVRFVEEQT